MIGEPLASDTLEHGVGSVRVVVTQPGAIAVAETELGQKIAQRCEFIVWSGETCLIPVVINNPPSPCTGICRIDWTSGHCEGCKRTLNEIADWPMLKPAEKRAILAQLPARASGNTQVISTKTRPC